ncbi:putative ATP-dependent endonuclease of OLD family [Pseudomonas sp. SORGH_AS199]|uniref:AAA family ATPase n=1 Tax=Pseudomonas sp. SORGH_AS_0199 TaxID=3041761 RepID=UPI0028644793|nr:AAA family ATPase [Pseudomonas sp. SORGH_AS_0199]MDR6229866.1 putative ATP-dependent endonuclease of OLD family [Pseudomonas sp. SORGH_AS_0199]
MITIDTVRISGFRGIKRLEITLAPTTILIGTNNAGKSSILKALQLALGDYGRYLSEEDFFIDPADIRTSEILIDLRIKPLSGNSTSGNFSNSWTLEFSDHIKQEANGDQFLALRTKVVPDDTKGGFEVNRHTLESWVEFDSWPAQRIKETKLSSRFQSIPLIPIEAQRDIHYELKEKTSFVGKVLSSIKYKQEHIASLETLIRQTNDLAIEQSAELSSLKKHLNTLSKSFNGNGTTELTPFPKKIRDLSKNFTVHFGESRQTFSMEYHGMGTRSWASMLTVKAFTEMTSLRHSEEEEPFFPIIAAEEPEAHLHPNAQRTLFKQLSETLGQKIISTHSPYLAGMADIMSVRSLRRTSDGCVASQLLYQITIEERNILAREVINKRAELLFARAVILCEGITEEQILPAMFEIFCKENLHELGISCVSVGGKNYSPYIKLACSLGIPTVVISDNDGSTKTEISAQLRRIKKDTKLLLENDCFEIFYLNENNDFEAELLEINRLRPEIVDSLVMCETKGSDNERYKSSKLREISAKPDEEIIQLMRTNKASYAGYLGEILIKNPNQHEVNRLLPKAVLEAFTVIKEWFQE